MSCHAVHKRFACDRCRDQKLRCPRADNNVNEPCQRCKRAGALCVTGGTRPVGRPRSSSTSRPSTGQDHFRRRQRDSMAPSPSSPSPSISTHQQRRPPTGAVEAAAILPWTNASSLAMSDYTAMSMESLLELPIPESSNASNPAQESPDSMAHFFGMFLPNGEFGQIITSTSPTGVLSFTADPGTTRRFDPMDHPVRGSLPENHKATPATAQSSNGTTPGLGSSDQEALISLSRLNESVSQQLAKIDSYPWQAPPAMQRLCSSKINSTNDNPVAETLQITTRFAAILRTLGVAQGRATSPSLGAATYLLLLCSYLQIVQLYDTIFRRIAEFLEDDATERDAGASAGTADVELQHEFRVAGLASMPPRLYLRLIVQILDHQLEAIEGLVGLPADCCVSGRAPARKGIFSDEDIARLLETVMGDTNDGSSGAFKGRLMVVSLRANMTAVNDFLRG
ncbi:uncharacterized protein B0T15DRAFT_214963 [Chaetomium strumarium]|uniref:Zn(2)-C6 fungal-type domain-containing protein n=1 Tax=Chaetomium strumarium TaxID=1170767 RepID=A0AAJ0M1X4_9PEZI|nr:hypothetical protein B0T15DRAFT_214963 [Chaetomium strumarium]